MLGDFIFIFNHVYAPARISPYNAIKVNRGVPSMKEVIVLRHGEKEGDNLTPQGITACEELVKRIGHFDLALASPRQRTIQTAELVSGLAGLVKVDNRASVPGFPASELDKLEEIQRTHGLGIIGAIWEKPALVEDARVAGQKLLDLVKETVDNLAPDQRALIVSHDGTMIGLEKLLLQESFDTVDHSFGPIEGFSINEHLEVKRFA